MSKTLFWYLLKDLLRIFLMTSATLAGIMSFGALLRPLTQHGLGLGQVGQILSYFSPAMMTYSLPVAALFATTIIYGRLSADNEITACRACGISSLMMTAPAFLLGLIVALISLIFLSFIVPVFTLKVEKVIYSNIAQLVANRITRTHEITYSGKTSIFAQSAEARPPEHGRQIVDLFDPIIFTYESQLAPDGDGGAAKNPSAGDKNDRSRYMKVPAKIWIARQATAYITPRGDKLELRLVLADGSSFPRGAGGSQLAVHQQEFGPIEMGTPVRENTKFMAIPELKRLLSHPESSRRLKSIVEQFIRDEQRHDYFVHVVNSLKDPALRSYRFDAETESLIVSGVDLECREVKGELVIYPRTEQDIARVKVQRLSNGEPDFEDSARQIRITVDPVDPVPGSGAQRRMFVHIREFDTVFEGDEIPAAHETLEHSINMEMPADLLAVEKNDVRHYLAQREHSRSQDELKYNYDKLLASIRSEMHSRASFAVSCFILVMVGAALGMISRSGNFLSAFAVSVVPALLCIALIVTGQHVCENTPKSMGLGLSLIWSGNIIVLVMAVFLLGKLQRQ